MLRALYEDVTITVRNCTPQPSSGGCISLLITGLMTRKVRSDQQVEVERFCVQPYSEDRGFTQALILSRQTDGYYIKTDTVLVFPRAKSNAGPSSLLSCPLPSSQTTEKAQESTEDSILHGPVTEQTKHPKKTEIEVSHARFPSFDVRNGTPLIGTSHGHTEVVKGDSQSLSAFLKC